MQRRHYIVLLCLSWAIGCGEAVAAASSNYHPVAVDTNAGTVAMSGWAPTQGPTTWFTIPVLDGNQTWSGSNTFSGVVIVNGAALYPAAYGYGYMHGPTQAFTTAGFEIITNFSSGMTSGMGAVTSSNLTVISDGVYQFTSCMSFDVTATGVEIIMRGFTNGVECVPVGWHTTLATANQYANAGASAVIRMYSNDVIDLRISVDKNTDIVFDHCDALLKKIGP